MPQGQISILFQNYFCLRLGAAVGLLCCGKLLSQLLFKLLSILRTPVIFHACPQFPSRSECRLSEGKFLWENIGPIVSECQAHSGGLDGPHPVAGWPDESRTDREPDWRCRFGFVKKCGGL